MKRFALVALALVSIACARGEQESETASPSAPTAERSSAPATASGDLATQAAALESCGYTPPSTEGPYYVSGTEELADGDLNDDDLEGTPMRVAGYVYASDENTDPVEGAKIEIWHTDADGAYHPEGNGPATRYSDDEISLRGYVTSDENGYYEFTSIFPGEYEGRSRHIHVRASGDGISDLISQIITSIEGDAFPPSGDMVASRFSECNIVDPVDIDGTRTVLFNLHVQPA